MTFKSLSIAFGTALALAGCVSSTADQKPATAPTTSPEATQLADVGINVGTAQQQVAREGTNNIVDAGLAVGMARSMGGPGLAAGVLGWLASQGPGLRDLRI